MEADEEGIKIDLSILEPINSQGPGRYSVSSIISSLQV